MVQGQFLLLGEQKGVVGPGWAGGLERMEAAMYDKEQKMRGREDMVYTYYSRRCRIYKVKHL